MPPRSPTLSVVIVNYRCWPETAALVDALRTQPAVAEGRAEIVVVDNHSPPHPLLASLRRLDGVSLRRWGRNRGFARAVNEGVRLSRGSWVLLLNPDVRIEADFLEKILARLDGYAPSVGVVGLRLLDADGSLQPSAGHYPHLTDVVVRVALPRRVRRCSVSKPPEMPARADWVTGCGMLLRRACFTALGGFDPAFFLYYEDVDLCRRATLAGWSVVCEPAVTLTHLAPLHTRRVCGYLRLLTRHGLMTYARRHWPSWSFQALTRIVRLEAVARGMIAVGDDKTHLHRSGDVALALSRGELARAETLLRRSIRRRESIRGKTEHRRPLPQPAGPAASVPAERDRLCPAGDGSGGRR